MKIHSKQFGEGIVQIETGSVLPRGTPFDDGRIFFLQEIVDKNPKGFYVYDATKARWTLINEHRSLELTHVCTTDGITYSLTAETGATGNTYATVVLSPDNTHARITVKGSGSGEAEGFIFRNADIGHDVIRADNESFEWMGNKVWHDKNLHPIKFQPRERAIDVRVNHLAQGQETLFVNTTAGEIIVKLPHLITVGDRVTIIDDAGTFGDINCIVNGRGQNINGMGDDYILNKSNTAYTFVYQNANRGWRVLKQLS